MNLLRFLQQKLKNALSDLVPDPAPYAAMVKPAQDPRHGDYQANCAMSLAKVLGRKPREVAEEIVRRLDLEEIAEPPEIAGPGFINLRLRKEWLAEHLRSSARSERLQVERAQPPRTIIVDYSSPNVAKPLHVGHLRSTIIGEALARLLRFLGHKVITDNHLGDWGTQFGMLLYGYKHFRDEEALRTNPVLELARLYVLVRKQTEGKEEEEGLVNPVAEAARQETAKLHAGDPENLRLWQMFLPWCLEEIDQIYRRLDVHFDHTHGESFYHPMLPEVVRSLESKDIARTSNSAVAIFFGPEDPPALIRKRDGAFTYTTTDLATIRYRMEEWHPDAILYVVDFRQTLHFKHLFEIVRRWGYEGVNLEHISFGSVLGKDGKPLKTRNLETGPLKTGEKASLGGVELAGLLDQAVQRGLEVYEESRKERLERGMDVPELPEEERRDIAEVVGLGAVKYADLSQNRTSDYVFDLKKMTATDGNTATYMQYAYVRTRGIFRKGAEDPARFMTMPPLPYLEKPEERVLAVQLLRLSEVIEAAAADFKPNLLTAYLWDLAKALSAFYQHCKVLEAETPVQRESRLLLCDLTARTIHLGLQLLGIRTVERM